MKFDQLHYHCPQVTAQRAAEQAMAVLKDAEQTDPGFLVYLLNYSNLLLLAGLRAESPYNTFQPGMQGERFERFRELLRRHDIEVAQEWGAYEEPNDAYSLFHTKAILQIPEQYAFTQPFWVAPKTYGNADYCEWGMYMHHHLVSLMEKGKLPKQWLRDWWAPHNILFGMLLGYPGEAIASLCYAEANYQETGAEDPIPVQWLPRDDYFGTTVGYNINPAAQKRPAPTKLFKLWKDVLAIVGKQYGKDRLMALPGFKDEYAAYEKYDQQYATDVLARPVE